MGSQPDLNTVKVNVAMPLIQHAVWGCQQLPERPQVDALVDNAERSGLPGWSD